MSQEFDHLILTNPNYRMIWIAATRAEPEVPDKEELDGILLDKRETEKWESAGRKNTGWRRRGAGWERGSAGQTGKCWTHVQSLNCKIARFGQRCLDIA
jgi:hypothetical protein